MPDHLKIEQPKQVIVEGNDDVRVFGALAKHLNIRDVQIHGYGGIDNLRRFLDTFRNLPEFGRVQSLAVVADANSDRDKRERRICNALSDMALPTPSHPLEIASNGELQVAYLVIPHNATGTMIEDVCLNSVSADPAMECVDRYFECLSQTEIEGLKKYGCQRRDYTHSSRRETVLASAWARPQKAGYGRWKPMRSGHCWN